MYGNSPILSIADEKERKAAEDRAQQAALRLQRKQRLEALIRKRKANVEYLKVIIIPVLWWLVWFDLIDAQKFHEGGCLWLNTTLFTSDDLRKYARVAVPKQRIQSYFMLGMSLARILYLPGGLPTVRAVAQLIEEWGYYHSGTAMQSVKYMMAKNSPCIYPQTAASAEGTNDLSRPTIFKFNSAVVYEYLDTTHIALELDYIEVLIALCDSLHSIYGKLFHEETFG